MLAVTGGNGDAQAERQRREEIEVVNAQLHEENERLRAQCFEAEQSVERLERELAMALLDQGAGTGRRDAASGGGMAARSLPREGVPPQRATPAAAQHPAGAVLRVDNAGMSECNGFYKENGVLGPLLCYMRVGLTNTSRADV